MFLEIFHNTPPKDRVRLGGGSSRECWMVPGAHGIVFKVHLNRRYSENRMEYATWDWVKTQPEKAKWLAPALELSPCGTFLAMIRTQQVNWTNDRLNWGSIPDWIHDQHQGNWGKIDGQFVCHDYALNRLFRQEHFTGAGPEKTWCSIARDWVMVPHHIVDGC